MSKIKEVVIDINQLGALSSTSIRMNRFILLSGESGLGKTYVSILCDYVYVLLTGHHHFDNFFKDKGLDDGFLQKMTGGEVETTITKDELETWINGNATNFLYYMLKSEKPVDVSYHFPIKEKMMMKISMAQQGLQGSEVCMARFQVEQSPSFSFTLGGEQVNSRNPFTAALQLYLQEAILGTPEALKNNYILPPGRGTVMTEGMEPRTGLYIEFKRQFDKLRESEMEGKIENTALEHAITEILDGRVYKKEGSGYYYSTRGEEIPITAAASSIREMAPLSLFVDKYDLKKCSLMIEEPEAHLHPMKQRLMADVLSLMFAGGCHLVISTHSDYFLRRMNEILSAQKIYQSDSINGKILADRLKVILSTVYDRSEISAYVLKRDPTTGLVAIIEQNDEREISFDSFDDVLQIDMQNYDAIQEYFASNEDRYGRS